MSSQPSRRDDRHWPPHPGSDAAREYLIALGVAIRTAPSPQERRSHRAAAVRAAETHRSTGEGYATIAAALGVSAGTLRHWRRQVNDAKPPRVLEPPPIRPVLPDLIDRPNSTDDVPRELESSLPTPEFVGRTDRPTAPELIPREVDVLVLSGHPHDGNTRLDLEIGFIRAALDAGGSSHFAAPCVRSTEIGPLITRWRPTILHLGAHDFFDGPLLAQDTGAPNPISWPELVETVGNATSRLRCAVVNVCNSHCARDLLDHGLEFVVTYGADLADDLAHDFAKSFYGGCPTSAGIGQCFDTAMRALTTSYPETSRLYRLHTPA